jgi:hypothetical protein|uniref:Putative potassium channel n=1 Tax=Florenciella giant virus FloV-SA1 TaxID=2775155 RepID=A0A7L7TB78_9VIRU|nr:putative potassium channel [Florenciella giant virus FloV-SA1]
MLFNKKNIFYKNIYSKIIILILSFILFGILYYFLCDDYEFGGINILQEEIRNSSLKKFVDKIESEQLNKEVKSEISEKISKEIRHPSIEEAVPKSNRLQKIFDRIYFSVVTGTTLGYGDIYPLSNKLKSLIIIQLFTTITILFS